MATLGKEQGACSRDVIERETGSIIDFKKLSEEAARCGAIAEVVMRSLQSLDSSVTPREKIRYLILHAYEQHDQNPSVYREWLALLNMHGIPYDRVDGALAKMFPTADSGSGEVAENQFLESHIPALTEMLANVSYMWRDIASSKFINLPQNIIHDIHVNLLVNNSQSTCFSRAMYEWIVGNHRNAKAPTVENLANALRGPTVGLGKEANQLADAFRVSLSHIPPCSDVPTPWIVHQPLTTEVVCDKMSTLLEVQVSAKGAFSYQWTKDGCPLKDSRHHLGVKKPILCILNASTQAAAGMYVCEIWTDHESGHQVAAKSRGTQLKVDVPDCKAILYELYHAMSAVHNVSWPPKICDAFINLALIGSEKPDKFSEFICYTLQGDADDILNKKESIEYREAFGEFRSGLFLIEGRPGSGKTTLVTKISKDWATGSEILVGADFLFLVSLRALPEGDISIEDILKPLYHKYGDEMVKNVKRILEARRGNGMCFILDGYDEYVSKENRESVIHGLIDRKYLSLSMVIVASRPIATADLKNKAGCIRYEVMGFLKDQIFEYIDNYPFSGRKAEKPKSLKAYLQEHPNIFNMCYLPIQAAMISYSHDNREGSLPHTETGIYEYFTASTLLRKLKKAKKDVYLETIEDLTGEEAQSFRDICELAFEMTLLSNQVFKVGKLGLGAESDEAMLGLVSVEHSAVEKLYTFVHLTLQEFLAAYHISKQARDDQAIMISEHQGKEHMKVVWKFYCGLVSFENDESNFRAILNSNKHDLFRCQCAFESQQQNTCALVKESGSLRFIDEVLSPSDFICMSFVLKCGHGLEELKFEKCIIGSAKLLGDVFKVCSKLQILDLSRNNIDNDDAKKLASGLEKCINLLALDLSRNDIGDSGAEALFDSLENCSALKSLNLHKNKISSKGIGYLCGTLLHCHNLAVLNLADNKLTSLGARALSSGLENCKSLRTFNVSSNNIIANGIGFIAQGLRYCTELESLIMDSNKISDSSAQFLSDCLRHCPGLQSLNFSYNEISENGAKAISGCLKHLNNLQALNLDSNHIGDGGAEALAANLNCSSLKTLQLQDNQISNAGACALAESLKLGASLEEVDISDNSIGDEGIKSLVNNLGLAILSLTYNTVGVEGGIAIAENLKRCPELKKLDLCIMKINCESVAAIARGLEYCALYLTKVDLSDNKIGDDGARALAEGLMLCSNLVDVDLMDNAIGDEGAVALAEGLVHCRCLENLLLDSNSIGDDGAKGLADVLVKCENLKSLSLDRNNIGDVGAKVLKRQCPVRFEFSDVVDLDNNNISSKGAVFLTESDTLDQRGKNIGDDGAVRLGELLESADCESLDYVRLSDNDIGDDGAIALAEGLKSCKNITSLNLSKNKIGNAGMIALGEALQECTKLESLDLQRNQIGDDGAKAFQLCLPHCCKLDFLNLDDNDIGGQGAHHLAQGLKCSTNLTNLMLSDNHIGDDGALNLGTGIKYCSNLDSLSLDNNLIGDIGARGLGSGLRRCRKLTTLQLQHNKISDDGTMGLAEGLQFCSKLEYLYLHHNCIADDGAKSLAMVLEHCSITTLELGHNQIGDAGISGLAAYCKTTYASITKTRFQLLESLELNNNLITSVGAENLAEGLVKGNKLETLDLDHNSIGDGAADLAKGLQHCKNLDTLRLSYNEIGDAGAKGLAKFLRHCAILETISLDHNDISDDGAAALAKCFQLCGNITELNLAHNNCSDLAGFSTAIMGWANLEVLDLTANNISNKGAKFLAQGTKECENLEKLILYDNTIGDEGARAISEGLQFCSKLDYLCLQHNCIADDGAKSLAMVLEHCRITTLQLNGNQIGDDGISGLAVGLKLCQLLERLELDNNLITSVGAKNLAEGLVKGNKLETLDLHHNSIGDGAADLAKGLQHCKNLDTLRLSYNEIGDAGAKGLAKFLRHCAILETISLYHNDISDDGAAALAKCFQLCGNITELDLAHNNCSCLAGFSTAIMGWANLEVLDLTANNISDEGAKFLAQGTKDCENLGKLILNDNTIGDEGARAISEILEQCSLSTLDLRNNLLSRDGLEFLSQLTELHEDLELLFDEESASNGDEPCSEDDISSVHLTDSLDTQIQEVLDGIDDLVASPDDSLASPDDSLASPDDSLASPDYSLNEFCGQIERVAQDVDDFCGQIERVAQDIPLEENLQDKDQHPTKNIIRKEAEIELPRQTRFRNLLACCCKPSTVT